MNECDVSGHEFGLIETLAGRLVCCRCGYEEPVGVPDDDGPPWEESPPDPVEVAIDTIIGSWDRWEAEAGQQAQQDQCYEAYRDTLAGHLRSVLGPLARG